MALPRHATRCGAHRASSWGALPATLGWAGRRAGLLLPAAARTPVVALVVATAFVAGSVTEVTWSQLQADAQRVAAEDAAVAAAQAQERHDAASVARLTAQATAYLAHRRTEALAIAQGAVETADLLAEGSQDYLEESERTELDAALAELTVLLERTPDAATALDDALAAAPEPEPVVVEAVEISPLDPLADAVELIGAGTSVSEDSPVEPAATQTAAERAADPVSRAAAEVRDVAAADEPSATPTTTADPTLATTEDAALADAAAAEGSAATGTSTVLDTALVPAVLDAADLDLTDSERLVEVAQRVLVLSAEVEAVVEERKAEEQARIEAEAAAAREAAREAAVLAALVDAADASPNGAIPTRYLCGVDFQSGVLLRCDAAKALEELNAAYRADTGRTLVVVSSYRTVARQTTLVEEKGDEIAAAPGTSQHGRGQAIDLAGAGSLGQFDAPLYLWLQQHAEDAGWHHPTFMEPGGSGPYEPWHWEYGTDS